MSILVGGKGKIARKSVIVSKILSIIDYFDLHIVYLPLGRYILIKKYSYSCRIMGIG